MTKTRIATYNVEWMNNLFESGEAAWRTSNTRPMGRIPKDPLVIAERIANVIREIDADIIGIEEGPALISQMKLFVKKFLKSEYDVLGSNSHSQNNFALVRKSLSIEAKLVKEDHRFYALLKRPVTFQPWGEFNAKKRHSMHRPPVLVQLHKSGSDDVIHVIVAHTKSQFTKGFTNKLFEARDPDAMKTAILSRQKLSADIAAYRRHVTHAIKSREAAGVILMGDINDGFNRSTFEREFLMQSLVDELRGSFRRQSALLEHVMEEDQLSKTDAYTVSFRDAERSNKITKELIDHILVTPRLRDQSTWLQLVPGSGRIAHEASAKHTSNNGKTGDDRPSDHVPVYADFKVK